MADSTDQIRKKIVLRAPQSRVWHGLTDSTEFGEWFSARPEGPFQEGEVIEGRITTPGFEHLRFEARVESIEPERRFSFRRRAQMKDPGADYTGEPTTLVEFVLTEAGDGTRLTVPESGFDAMPRESAAALLRRDGEGRAGQLKNIERHVDG